MAPVLELVSDVLPLTYAYEALARATADDVSRRLVADAVVVAAWVVLALILGAATLRRRTP